MALNVVSSRNFQISTIKKDEASQDVTVGRQDGSVVATSALISLRGRLSVCVALPEDAKGDTNTIGVLKGDRPEEEGVDF